MEKPITGRPQRNRRHSRRAWPPEDDLQPNRPIKRLFTPEIKRMLKDWLIRRRDNPYPSRDEKKRLAVETGLTYTQICNWFANWRRKLKNSERERAKKSWGHLIKNYNTNARGNVEQFSISSEDSIWEEGDRERVDEFDSEQKPSEDESHEDGGSCGTDEAERGRAYFDLMFKPNYYVESADDANRSCDTTGVCSTPASTECYRLSGSAIGNGDIGNAKELVNGADKPYATPSTAKYKQKMMEKYLRDTRVGDQDQPRVAHGVVNIEADAGMAGGGGGAELSKWLESAAKFTPNKNNYYIEWNGKSGKLDRKKHCRQIERVALILPSAEGPQCLPQLQQRPQQHSPTQLELDAAEALANLAFHCRQRLRDTSMPAPINAVSS